MKKFLIVTLLLAAALISVGRAHAQTPTPITIGGAEDNSGGVGLPGSHDPKTDGPIALVANLYDFALAAGGILAFGSILFGAVMYLTQPGNHEAQSSAKARIRDAFLGLLLLLGIYLILHTVNPALTKLQFPVLQRLAPPVTLNSGSEYTPNFDPKADVYACETDDDTSKIVACWATKDACDSNCQDTLDRNDIDLDGKCVQVKGNACNTLSGVTSGPSTNATCQQHAVAHPGANSCSPSPSVSTLMGCIKPNIPGLPITSTEGTHAANSCHFGGRTCKDGGHAIDVGINGAKSVGKTLPQVKATVEACGKTNSLTVSCRYENSGGSFRSWGDSDVNHIHCNVNVSGCGCL